MVGKVLKETAEEGRGSVPLQVWRRASENNAKTSHTALSSLTDDCHPTDTLLSLESFQIWLPAPVAARGKRGLLQRSLGGQPAPLRVLLHATNRRAEQSWLQTRCLAKAAAAWQPTCATTNTTASSTLSGGHVLYQVIWGRGRGISNHNASLPFLHR